MKDTYTDDESLVFLEMRNVYILCLSQLYQVMMHVKFETETGMSTEEVDDEVLLGFNLISKKTKKDEDVKEFLAKTMTKDIINNSFPNHKFNLEEDIHRRYKNKDLLVKDGIYKVIIDIFYTYDSYLADYLTCNIDILKEYESTINNYIERFDEFEYQNEKNRFHYMEEETKDYCDECNLDFNEYFFRALYEKKLIYDYVEYSDKYDNSDLEELELYALSTTLTNVNMNHINIRNIVSNYLKERIVNEKLSTSNNASLKKKLDKYLEDFNDLTDTELIKGAEDILSNIKTNKEYDFAINYLINESNNRKDNIVPFKKIKKRKYEDNSK